MLEFEFWDLEAGWTVLGKVSLSTLSAPADRDLAA